MANEIKLPDVSGSILWAYNQLQVQLWELGLSVEDV
jgi:hypothetical protein